MVEELHSLVAEALHTVVDVGRSAVAEVAGVAEVAEVAEVAVDSRHRWLLDWPRCLSRLARAQCICWTTYVMGLAFAYLSPCLYLCLLSGP